MLTFQNPSFEATISKEWLFTNGIGGYASSTIIGANSRRYHGLLVASLNPPTQRQVLVSKIEESISIQRHTNIEFSTNQYPGVVHPQGYQYLTSFERLPLPRKPGMPNLPMHPSMLSLDSCTPSRATGMRRWWN